MNKISLILIAISILHFSCSKKDTPSKAVVTSVYVAGTDFDMVALWNNGQQLFWNGNFGFIGNAYGVAIKDTNVYVAGHISDRALYWKNGQQNFLSDPSSEIAVARSIYFSGNDMYIAGVKLVSSSAYQAGYWKNGVFNVLFGVPFKSAECRDIAVVNNNVHAVGYADISTLGGGDDIAAVYWKNGDSTILAKGGLPLLNAIKVVEDDVYIAGRNTYNGAYWKNGVFYSLGDFTEALDIDVSGSDVYVAGYTYANNDYTATYWKNGEKVILEPGFATGIQIVDGDIYISGNVKIDDVSTAVYWKNGVRNSVGTASQSGFTVSTTGIGVMKR